MQGGFYDATAVYCWSLSLWTETVAHSKQSDWHKINDREKKRNTNCAESNSNITMFPSRSERSRLAHYDSDHELPT